MARRVGIGHQNFEDIIITNNFYVDKTMFIREWWENNDVVTLITRPRRFGKTLNMSMIEQFFSVEYADRGDLFNKLDIWKYEEYRELQGTYPVISLSFANIKETDYYHAREKICQIIAEKYDQYAFLLEEKCLTEGEKKTFCRKNIDMNNTDATLSLNQLSEYLYRYYGKKVIILLDEYDTPLQETYVHGYWNELALFIRSLFNATFKTNPRLGRAIMTGITRTSKESMFSDLNNLKVITTTSDKYAEFFGFTEKEVFQALDEFEISDRRQEVKEWYDGFVFGHKADMYNPWSIINFLDTEELAPYWANTSSNSLAGKLIREGSKDIKIIMEDLLEGKTFQTLIDEQLVFDQLDYRESDIWSFLLASGYLRVNSFTVNKGQTECDLVLTNKEVNLMFEQMIRDWFSESDSAYNDFVKAMLQADKKAMNAYMNRIALSTFSYFDTGKRASKYTEPERFYHGFVLGLIVELEGRYIITSNRESGFGRYDVMLEPLKQEDDAIILEFKVYDPEDEKSLKDTVDSSLKQIERMRYAEDLERRGIEKGRIRKYGFAFEGKRVLIG